MGYAADRDQTLIELGRAGFTTRQARQLLSLGTTLHRLAEGQCNGDWPWDNGERPILECEACGSGCAPEALKKGDGTPIDPMTRECPVCHRAAGLECVRTDRSADGDFREVRTRPHRSRGKSGKCPDCRAQDRVRAILRDGPKMCHRGHNFYVETDPADAYKTVCCDKPAWQAYFQGDPRGCVLALWPAGVSHEDMYCGRDTACPAGMRPISIPGRY